MTELMKKIFFLSLFLLAFANAETVFVDVKGDVDLETFSCSKTNSVLIKRVCYQSEDSYLLVQIKDNWFQHCSVEQKKIRCLDEGQLFQSFL